MKQILVNTSKQYYINVDKGLFARLEKEIQALYDGCHVYVITDENLANIYKDELIKNLGNYEVKVVVTPAGEEAKSMATYEQVTKELLNSGICRGELLIAFGGGVIGDLTGFIAATLFRGLPFVQIPTSLISMVDSSIGGKTAINLDNHKNILGCFKQPEAVLIDVDLLKTLPIEELKSGFGEVIKHAAIMDENLLGEIEKLDDVREISEDIIIQNIMIKKAVVEQDEFDNGKRMILNFGHTFGHIIELEKGLKHGEAVLSGMLAAIDMGLAFMVGSKDNRERLEKLYKRLDLKYIDVNYLELLPEVTFDKKNIKGHVNFIFLTKMGKTIIYPLGLDKLCAL